MTSPQIEALTKQIGCDTLVLDPCGADVTGLAATWSDGDCHAVRLPMVGKRPDGSYGHISESDALARCADALRRWKAARP